MKFHDFAWLFLKNSITSQAIKKCLIETLQPPLTQRPDLCPLYKADLYSADVGHQKKSDLLTFYM